MLFLELFVELDRELHEVFFDPHTLSYHITITMSFTFILKKNSIIYIILTKE
jgi:hypothetical protein